MSKKLTIDEGLQLALAGEDIILLTPKKMSVLWISDIADAKKAGGYCMMAEDFKAPLDLEPKAPEPDEAQYPQIHEDNGEVTPPVKKSKIDAGKIKALADAGWSVQKIAEEMGISAPTVRRYLKEGGEG